MKIGIITLHANTNYGANLQAFALTCFLNNNGISARVINHSVDDAGNSLIPWLMASWHGERDKSVLRCVKLGTALALSIPWKSLRLHRFHRFQRNYMNLTKKCVDKQQIANLGFDTVICGSDQIWNPDITNGLNPIFFGRIDGVTNRIAYAASIGKAALNAEEERVLKRWAEELDACSLREANSADYLSKLINRDVVCVCDPTLLLSKEQYEQIAKHKLSGKFVLLYSIVRDSQLTEQAEIFAAKNGLEVIEICSGKQKGSKHKQINTFGPEEFIGALLDAQYVFTNSFHGVAMSIMLEKQFFAYENPVRKGRITNILEKAGLIDRLLAMNAEVQDMDIDYSIVAHSLSDYISSSREFLLRNIQKQKSSLAGEKCVGCGACFEVCQMDAVRLYPDSEGFLTAFVDSTKCINCGRCQRACQAFCPTKGVTIQDMYALKAPDDLRLASASGGAFASFASMVLEQGGSVYGACQDSLFHVYHKRCANAKDLLSLQGTKYVQSDMRACYPALSRDLKDGKPVFFSGTPCQVAALKNYITEMRIPDDALYTTDIICHGVPSPSVYAAFLLWLRKSYNIKEYHFRSKTVSWRGNSCLTKLQDGTELKNDRMAASYMNLYYSGNIMRKSCYSCPFACEKRISDITIGDFWGIETSDNAAFEDPLGVSMVIPNTEKGRTLLGKCDARVQKTEIITSKQPQLKEPTEMPSEREMFWRLYTREGIDKVLSKYGGIKQGLKSKIKSVIRE